MRYGLLFLVLLAACVNAEHPGFKEVDNDVHLRYHALGDGEMVVQPTDSIELMLRVALSGEAPGSLLSIQRWCAAADVVQGAFVPVFQRMHVGDSISLITPSQGVPWSAISPLQWSTPEPAAVVQLEFALLRIRTKEMIAAEQLRHRTADPEGYQRGRIAAHRSNSTIPWQVWGTSDLHFYIAGAASDTARVVQGDMVFVTWQGRRLEDGVVVDDRLDEGDPFAFRFGDQDQVISGIETAVALLREGQQGEFIVPAQMAFGERGVKGLVEPWSPLLYTVKLVRVQRR